MKIIRRFKGDLCNNKPSEGPKMVSAVTKRQIYINVYIYMIIYCIYINFQAKLATSALVISVIFALSYFLFNFFNFKNYLK